MKKILSLLLVVFSVGLMLPSCGEGKAEREARIREEARLEERARLEEQAKQAQLERERERAERERERAERERERKAAVYGTWKCNDAFGAEWVIEINEDNTIRMSSDGIIRGAGSLYQIEPSIWINTSSNPPIVFPNMKEGFSGFGVISDGYLYWDVDAYKAKNPSKRLSIRKVS